MDVTSWRNRDKTEKKRYFLKVDKVVIIPIPSTENLY